MPERDAYVLRGPTHRYRLGTELGRRVFHAEDEEGRRWAVKIAERQHLLLRQRLGEQLPPGALPAVRELVDLGGGRLAFLVTELIPGVRLRDLLVDGRTLPVAEARRLLAVLADHAMALRALSWPVKAFGEEDVLYDTERGAWRAAVTGEIAEGVSEAQEVRWIAELVVRALGEELSRAHGPDERLAGLLVLAQEGRVALQELRDGARGRRLWRGIRSQS